MKVKVYLDNSWKFSVEAIFQEQKSNNLDRGFDNEYIELFLKKGFVVDLLIIFKTLIIVLSMKNTIEGEK